MTIFTSNQGYLDPDSSQRIILEELAADETFFPGAWARNILISCDLMDYSEPIVFSNNLN